MDASAQQQANYPIHSYLSYRCKNQPDIEARELLKTLCAEQDITLRYDETETEQGDSLIEFMGDLSSARCVILFLSPDYFQSAYTLFEMISINEWLDEDHRFILPLRLSESMVTYEWTAAKHYFAENEAVRNELRRLLKKHHPDENTNLADEDLWQRIDAVWQSIIFPHLDRLHCCLENTHAQTALGELLKETQKQVSAAIDSATDRLQDSLVKKLTVILERKNINADELFREQLNLTANNKLGDIATKLVKKTEVGESIAILTRVLKSKKRLLGITEWNLVFYDVEQLCSWLLLNSVNPVWWFHHQIKLKKTAEISISQTVYLQDANYMEVIIARSLLRTARYTLDENKLPKPDGQTYDVTCFDANTATAKNEELLIGIYKDLYSVEPSNDVDLLSNIIRRAKSYYMDEKRDIYYLVSSDYLAIWESLVKDQSEMQELTRYLQFICCEQLAKPNHRQACKEDQSQLLNQVAYLIALQD